MFSVKAKIRYSVKVGGLSSNTIALKILDVIKSIIPAEGMCR